MKKEIEETGPNGTFWAAIEVKLNRTIRYVSDGGPRRFILAHAVYGMIGVDTVYSTDYFYDRGEVLYKVDEVEQYLRSILRGLANTPPDLSIESKLKAIGFN